jgi:hypothetical protein
MCSEIDLSEGSLADEATESIVADRLEILIRELAVAQIMSVSICPLLSRVPVLTRVALGTNEQANVSTLAIEFTPPPCATSLPLPSVPESRPYPLPTASLPCQRWPSQTSKGAGIRQEWYGSRRGGYDYLVSAGFHGSGKGMMRWHFVSAVVVSTDRSMSEEPTGAGWSGTGVCGRGLMSTKR